MINNKKNGAINVVADFIRSLSSINFSNNCQADLENIPHGDGHPVLVFPGFMTNDISTATLRKRLISLGYDARPWDHGINLGQNKNGDILDSVSDLLKKTYMRSSRTVSLIGWSLGGVIAREAARYHPEQVRTVISLGSPIGGSPRHSPVWKLYELISRVIRKQKNIDEWIEKILQPVEGVHCISIYSDNDAVIPSIIACEQESHLTENIKVDSSHIGLPFNIDVFKIICERLAQPEINWQPYR